MKKKYILLVAISALVIAIDQVIKMYIHTHFQLGESTVVIQDIFNLTYVRNPGAAFGFLARTDAAFRDVFFLAMPPIALAVIYTILRSVDDTDTLQIVALSSVFGGAIGNYIDRIRFSYVIDFLDFHYKNVFNYPAFNIADSAIVGGVIVLLLLTFIDQKKPRVSNSRN